MKGEIAGLYRYPVKGLTPEALASVRLDAGRCIANDRRYAVEVGPSGFDPANPAHISKQRFTVLARFPSLARLRTRLDDVSGAFHIGDAHGFGVEAMLATEEGRSSLARFLQAFLGEHDAGPFRVLEAPGHHFTDHPKGHVSLINLASVRAVEQAIGQPVDPLRFRANIYVEGLPAWAEDEWVTGQSIVVGAARLSVFAPIVRCVATDVAPDTGERDIDMLDRLREFFGRTTLGVYLHVAQGEQVAPGDAVEA